MMSDARDGAKIPDGEHRGHGTDDVGDRRQQRSASVPEHDDTEVTRTPRVESSQRDDSDAGGTRSGNSSQTGSRTTIPGNTSETGAGSPTADTTTNRAPRTGQGQLPAGCGKSTAGMMLIAIALSAAVSRIARR